MHWVSVFAQCLLVATLVVALTEISPSLPVILAGSVGAFLFVVATVSDLLDHRP
jgi:hypothetical protein